MLFCQFHSVPARNTFNERMEQHLVRTELDRRWADYFNNCDDFYVDQTHFSFKASQMAFRDEF
eukprot:2115538-Alexandrium_andersonii.AAC.1